MQVGRSPPRTRFAGICTRPSKITSLTFRLNIPWRLLGLPDVDEALIDLAFQETDTPKTPLEIWRTAEGDAVGRGASRLGH